MLKRGRCPLGLKDKNKKNNLPVCTDRNISTKPFQPFSFTPLLLTCCFIIIPPKITEWNISTKYPRIDFHAPYLCISVPTLLNSSFGLPRPSFSLPTGDLPSLTHSFILEVLHWHLPNPHHHTPPITIVYTYIHIIIFPSSNFSSQSSNTKPAFSPF